MTTFWIIFTLLCIWLFLGLIALSLVLLLLPEDDEKLTFGNAMLIIVLGFISLLGVSMELQDLQDQEDPEPNL